MNCTMCQAVLDDYADGTLAPEVRMQVDTHLQACRQCRARAVELEALTQLLARHAEPEPSAEFTAAVLARTVEPTYTRGWVWPVTAAALLSVLVLWTLAPLAQFLPWAPAWGAATLGGLAASAVSLWDTLMTVAPLLLAAAGPPVVLACGVCLVLAACVAIFGRRALSSPGVLRAVLA